MRMYHILSIAIVLAVIQLPAVAVVLDVDNPSEHAPNFIIRQTNTRSHLLTRGSSQTQFVMLQQLPHMAYKLSTTVIGQAVSWANGLFHPTTGGSLVQPGVEWSITGTLLETIAMSMSHTKRLSPRLDLRMTSSSRKKSLIR